MLTIETRTTTGRDRSPSYGVPLSDRAADGGLTLRELLALATREELAAFQERRIERTFAQVLTAERIAAGGKAGRIDSGQRRAPAPPPTDVAIETAIEAFQDGLFLVLVDGRQESELDAQVMIGVDSTVTFIRLVALAGG